MNKNKYYIVNISCDNCNLTNLTFEIKKGQSVVFFKSITICKFCECYLNGVGK